MPTFFIADIFQFFQSGGVFMIPLLICSVLSLGMIFHRWMELRLSRVMPPEMERAIHRLAPGQEPHDVAKLARAYPSPLGRIIRVALQNLRWPRAENVEAVQTRARQETLGLERGLVLLELTVGLSPLLGLLGTVSGLVTVFGNLGPDGVGSDPLGVARGISEALHTTIMGLAVAMPSLVAFGYFSKRVETYAVQMESLVDELLSKCYLNHPTEPSPMAIDMQVYFPASDYGAQTSGGSSVAQHGVAGRSLASLYADEEAPKSPR
ncbi:MAG: MotA/TolQ/ExbB proton channel family protein [Verrucomicrobiales bacterium]